ncbi:Lipoprotein, partial [Pseudomonas ficuserectae]
MNLAYLKVAVSLFAVALLTPPTVDYSAFKESKPRSILVLPPVNESPDVKATYSTFSQVTYPLAESGYYVLPVALVDETFRNNGLTNANDIQATSPAKLRDIFGADAAMYITVKQYGTSYVVISSQTVVTVTAKLVDLRTGTALWTGTASASSEEGGNNSGGGLVGMLITAAVKQIINSSTDAGHPIAGIASNRLLTAGRPA